MQIRSNVVVLVSLLGLAACGGASASGKDAADPWAGYTGKYAGVAEPRGNATPKNAERSRDDAKAAKAAKTEAAKEEAPAPARKTSKATVHGESISTVEDAALADAAKSALKTKVVSTTIASGAQYERVKVQLKGATVQIIRPVAPTEGSAGTANVDAPKSRSAALAKNEAGYYDEEADVLVIVEAAKKSAAEKALGSLVSH